MFRLYQQTLRVCYQVALIDHRLVLGLVGLVGRILLVEKLLLLAVEEFLLAVVEQLLLAVVDQLLNPILLSNRDEKRSLAEVEVTCMLSHDKTSPVFQSDNFWNTISWKCSLKDDCIRSSLIEF